ncbi:hypothetical protein SAMN05720354_10164 [Nitrosospira sp. Nsp1]|nr:hypothetical protein SAMN05720354_10164 [Nitrosospira sp. Nsp1]
MPLGKMQPYTTWCEYRRNHKLNGIAIHRATIWLCSHNNLTLLAYVILGIVCPVLFYGVHSWALVLVVVVAKITFWLRRGKITQDSLAIILP